MKDSNKSVMIDDGVQVVVGTSFLVFTRNSITLRTVGGAMKFSGFSKDAGSCVGVSVDAGTASSICGSLSDAQVKLWKTSKSLII